MPAAAARSRIIAGDRHVRRDAERGGGGDRRQRGDHRSGTSGSTGRTSLLYQKDAFAFATADLVMPQGVDFATREVLDGISMRIVRQYDINNDKFPCRLDVLYGYKTLRPQLACRLHNN